MEWSDRKFQITVIILLLAVVGTLFFLDFIKAEQTVDRVAYVNLEKIFNEHPARTAAEEKLNQKAAEYQQQLETEGEELSGKAQKELLLSYQNKLQELESELLKSVLAEVETIIVKTAAAKKFKFVLEEKDVLYGGYNLTDDILAELEAEW